MSFNSYDDQAKKTKATNSQIKASLPTFNQSKITKKAKKKAKKEKTEGNTKESKTNKKDKIIVSLQ